MRTLGIITGGFVLLAIVLGFANLFGAAGASAMMRATIIFVMLWLAAASAILWVGVYRTGYSFREELPIFLLIFMLPAVVAVLVKWKFF
jgi:hypothetical protein